MAENQFILRPVADISVTHRLYPKESSAAHLLINEETPDDDATYIIAVGDEIMDMQHTSSWRMGGIIPEKISELTNITAYIRGKGQGSKVRIANTHFLSLNIAGAEIPETLVASFGENWFTAHNDISDAISVINEHLEKNAKFPSISVTLRSHMDGTSSGSITSQFDFCITQFYLEVTYKENSTIGIGIKSGAEWRMGKKVYQKNKGIWSEVLESEAKTILKNNNIRRG